MSISEPSLRRFVEEQVATGRHASADEVIEHALRLYREKLAAQEEHDAMLRREAELGIADIEAGRYHWIVDSKQLTESIRQELRELERPEPPRKRGKR